MNKNRTRLIEVFQIGSERGGVLELPRHFWPKPGQYLPCQNLEREVPPLVPQLFRILGQDEVISVGLIPRGWQPGDRLAFEPPQGQGFQPPKAARRIALLPFKVSPIRLLPLVQESLALGAAISVFYDKTPIMEIIEHLPSVVEVSPIEALFENIDWPDFLAADVERDDLDEFSKQFDHIQFSFQGQVLVRTLMPCRGIGECSVCTVKTLKGWQRTCVDGPVFPLKDILHVAQ